MTLLFDEAKVQVPDDPRKPPRRIIQLERCDRIGSLVSKAIQNPILELEGAETERENIRLTLVECWQFLLPSVGTSFKPRVLGSVVTVAVVFVVLLPA